MALPLLPLAIGGQLLGGALQLFGAGKRRRAAQAAQNRMQGNLNRLDTMAREGMPESQYTQGLQNIQRNQSAAIKMLQNMGGGSALRGISGVVSQSNDATLGLDVQDALQRQKNRLYAFQQRQAMDNQMFQQESQAAQALTGSGLQNLFGAFSNAATTSILSGGDQGSINIDSLFGNRRRNPLQMINSTLQPRTAGMIQTGNLQVNPIT